MSFSLDAHAQNGFLNPSSFETLTWLPETQPDARIRYGDDSPVQFGDLRLPEGEAPADGHPVIVFIHGGAWHSDWPKDLSSKFVEELTKAGYATWDLEYRRLGNTKGGYPETFLDVGRGIDHLAHLAEDYPLDLGKVILVGHSSGGHLALWAAGRKNLPEASPLRVEGPTDVAGVVSIAGVNDLNEALVGGNRTDTLTISGLEPEADPSDRFRETSPGELLPLGVPHLLILGSLDNDWRIAMTHKFGDAAKEAGDSAKVVVLDGANHFDVVDPRGPMLGHLLPEIETLLESER